MVLLKSGPDKPAILWMHCQFPQSAPCKYQQTKTTLLPFLGNGDISPVVFIVHVIIRNLVPFIFHFILREVSVCQGRLDSSHESKMAHAGRRLLYSDGGCDGTVVDLDVQQRLEPGYFPCLMVYTHLAVRPMSYRFIQLDDLLGEFPCSRRAVGVGCALGFGCQ